MGIVHYIIAMGGDAPEIEVDLWVSSTSHRATMTSFIIIIIKNTTKSDVKVNLVFEVWTWRGPWEHLSTRNEITIDHSSVLVWFYNDPKSKIIAFIVLSFLVQNLNVNNYSVHYNFNFDVQLHLSSFLMFVLLD